MEAGFFSSYTVYEIEDYIHHKHIYIIGNAVAQRKEIEHYRTARPSVLPSARKFELVLPTSLSVRKLSQKFFSSFEMQIDRPSYTSPRTPTSDTFSSFPSRCPAPDVSGSRISYPSSRIGHSSLRAAGIILRVSVRLRGS